MTRLVDFRFLSLSLFLSSFLGCILRPDIVPVFDSVVFKHFAHSSPLGAKTIEQEFKKSLALEQKFSQEFGAGPWSPDFLQSLKEHTLEVQNGPVAPKHDLTKQFNFASKTYHVGAARVKAPQALFDPYAFGLNSLSITDVKFFFTPLAPLNLLQVSVF